MSYRVGTHNYNLPQTEGTDKRDWADTNQAFLAIDTAIKNAVDTSASARSAASTAQTTADSAATAAANAQTSASAAQTLATSASELATTAKTRADNAYTLANTANTTANNALPKSDVEYLGSAGTVSGTRYDGMSIKGHTIVTISLNNVTASANTVLMTLPAKLRPSLISTLPIVVSTGASTTPVFLTVSTNGNISSPSALAGHYGNITFIY